MELLLLIIGTDINAESRFGTPVVINVKIWEGHSDAAGERLSVLNHYIDHAKPSLSISISTRRVASTLPYQFQPRLSP